ncbi:hypothetical protein LJ737_19745 [Hymenobacter sp. 15J16-1T3B]|uniref:hypothetical protein n=1 Tax=Hymenobacter sp. 15J16-1T3B TaxID=2886941 RepID=UPI001D1235D5|nr:hypothetical protein [Hymenobacter sp. 15J16-1T3B]MCC3159485.1 hypothetical protein [Hymenobacter sp. 15J16-1T3B]
MQYTVNQSERAASYEQKRRAMKVLNDACFTPQERAQGHMQLRAASAAGADQLYTQFVATRDERNG